MKWFKHISDSLDDPFINDLLDEFGSDGYLAFFGFLEMMSREFNIKSPGKVTLSHNYCRRKLRLSWHKCSTILKFCEMEGRFFVEDDGRKVTINCPKLKALTDDWTARQLRSQSEVAPKKSALDIEEEEDIEEDSIKENIQKKVGVKRNGACPHQKILDLYHKNLPALPAVKVWGETSQKNLRMRWKEAPERQDLEQWDVFFKYVAKSDFLTGKVKDWCADLMWIVKPDNFAKILNGVYHKNQPKTSRLEAHNQRILEAWINEP